MWRTRAQLPSLLLFTINNTTAFRAPLQTDGRPSHRSCCTCVPNTRRPGETEDDMRIGVWSITEQCRHPPSMSAGAGLGAESVLACVLGRTDRRCSSLHTPGHCTLGLSHGIMGRRFPDGRVAEIQKMSPSTTGRCYCCP